MSDDDQATESLIKSSKHITKIEINTAYRVRNKRSSIRMAGLTAGFAAFVLISVVYGVKYSSNEKYEFFTDEKLTVKNWHQAYAALWTYDCVKNECIRRPLMLNETPNTLESCNMMCFLPSLWPKPKSINISNRTTSTFKKNFIILNTTGPNSVERDVREAFTIFLNNLPNDGKLMLPEIDLDNVFVNVKVIKDDNKPTLDTDESYHLIVKRTSNIVEANITAPTYFGARHGLETLSQLVWLDDESQLQIYHDIEIRDRPAFPHRGLMVDTARNFFPIPDLLQVLDGMAANKLNVFHLHLTDSVSFSVNLPTNPWLAEFGAYSPDKVYKAEDIKRLVEYARVRGIRVILEIDAPSHANEGWNHANKDDDKIIICGEDDVNNGHLNPDNIKTFKLLQSIYSDLLELGTDNETFHVGGDEVNLDCYRNTKSAKNFTDIYEFWADLNNEIFKTVTKAFRNNPPTNVVIWSNDLTNRYMSRLRYSKNVVVQYWFGELQPILDNGNKIIFSTVGKWYLDCGFGPWKSSDSHGSCDPYTHWKVFYTYRPWARYTKFMDQVMGGEACLWTEQVDANSLETRIWPRTAALAERLWSDIPIFDSYDVFTRISSQRDRLINRGFKAAAIWPEWCTRHPGKC